MDRKSHFRTEGTKLILLLVGSGDRQGIKLAESTNTQCHEDQLGIFALYTSNPWLSHDGNLNIIASFLQLLTLIFKMEITFEINLGRLILKFSLIFFFLVGKPIRFSLSHLGLWVCVWHTYVSITDFMYSFWYRWEQRKWAKTFLLPNLFACGIFVSN